MDSQDRRDSTSAGTTARPVPGESDLLNRAAPLLFVLLWSSSFLGARVGLRHMSPLLFVAVRMVLAAAIMVVALAAVRRIRPNRGASISPTAWLHCSVVGVSTQAILLMTAHEAMTRTEAAPIALIQTLNPLLSAAFAWPHLHIFRSRYREQAGEVGFHPARRRKIAVVGVHGNE